MPSFPPQGEPASCFTDPWRQPRRRHKPVPPSTEDSVEQARGSPGKGKICKDHPAGQKQKYRISEG